MGEGEGDAPILDSSSILTALLGNEPTGSLLGERFLICNCPQICPKIGRTKKRNDNKVSVSGDSKLGKKNILAEIEHQVAKIVWNVSARSFFTANYVFTFDIGGNYVMKNFWI